MTRFYEKIEEPIRDLVRLLRDNGYNTECSCGHKMYVQCQYQDGSQIDDLKNLIWMYLYEKNKKINFKMEVLFNVMDGFSHSHILINLGDDVNCG